MAWFGKKTKNAANIALEGAKSAGRNVMEIASPSTATLKKEEERLKAKIRLQEQKQKLAKLRKQAGSSYGTEERIKW